VEKYAAIALPVILTRDDVMLTDAAEVTVVLARQLVKALEKE